MFVALGAKQRPSPKPIRRWRHSSSPRSESQRALAVAIDRLPAEQREVLVMKIWNELTFADIGTVLGIPQNTAASRYRYALCALKKNLTNHE